MNMRKSFFVSAKIWYINFLKRKDKYFFSMCLYYFLVGLSYIYQLLLFLRNKAYDYKFFPVYSVHKKVISVGNISWGGVGKTSLVSYLHTRLSSFIKVASITKGYAKDEVMLLKNKLDNVFDSKNRVSLIRSLEKKFDLFILDDGFQYRRLKRDLDIVIISSREFCSSWHLLPADVLREPLKSLRRADIVVINYWRLIHNLDYWQKRLLSINPRLKIYLSEYIPRGFLDKNRRLIKMDYFQKKKVAVLTAIGYPQGFIDILRKLSINIKKIFIYPDHYEFDRKDLFSIEQKLKKNDIYNIIITYKDFYHIDLENAQLNYFILDVDLKIEEEENFFNEVKKVL